MRVICYNLKFCYNACRTAIVLDFLSFKTLQSPRRKGMGAFRILIFAISLLYFVLLFSFYSGNLEHIMFVSFIIGNLLYYALGILLAFMCKDNRAFCKYLCPITVFLKPSSYFSLFRIKVDTASCISCGKCIKACPANAIR